EAGAAHEQRAREELQAALERGSSVGQHELRKAVEAAQRADQARALATAEAARLRIAFEQVQTASGEGASPDAEVLALRARLEEADARARRAEQARDDPDSA